MTLINLGQIHLDAVASYLRGSCPNCGESYSVVATLSKGESSGKMQTKEVFVHPSPKTSRNPIITPEQFGDEKLYKAYAAALTTYDKGAIESVPVAVGRTLEGIVKTYLTSKGVAIKKGMLAALLQQLAEDVDLSQPLRELADALREGRNIGAHFDEVDPTPEMAEKMLDLLDVIVEYLYLLPSQINELKGYMATPTP